ncbi:MAG: DUF2007 domain-containing protein [Planctomycetota bacterium]
MTDGKLVQVYKATNGMEAQVIRSLLDSYGIPSVLKSDAAPSILNFTVDGLGEVRVMVLDSRADEARDLIENSQSGEIDSGDNYADGQGEN